jgi:hypothetical protein
MVFVMAGLVPAIHDFLSDAYIKTWMPATSAGMTEHVVRLDRNMLYPSSSL